MGKEKSSTMRSFFGELFQAGVYKRTQGRIARQVTFAVIMLGVILGAWRLYLFVGPHLRYTEDEWNTNFFVQGWMYFRSWPYCPYFMAGFLLAIGLWLGYRLVNLPQFADFLIAVEAEMNKVSWPSRGELLRSALVVIVVIFILATVLFTFDMIWQSIFAFIGVRPG